MLAGAALIALPVLLTVMAHKSAPSVPPDLRDAPVSAAAGEQLQGMAPAGWSSEAVIPQPGANPIRAAQVPASGTVEGNTDAEIARRCAPVAAGEPSILQSDFHWAYTLPDMALRFEEMYVSPKRLAARAYWDEKTRTIRLPYMAERGGSVKVAPAFIQAVERHIERSIELKYVDAVFFPDMGHSHLLVPETLWKEKYDLYPIDHMSMMYQDMFLDPRLRIFYHTAEQLKTREADGQLVNDERTRFRYKTRNISGFIKPDADLTVHQNPESTANTVHEIPGYFWWGAGFNMSAQQNGCFVYHSGNKTYRFDLSLYDLPEEQPSEDFGR